MTNSETFPSRPPNYINNPNPGYGNPAESGRHRIEKKKKNIIICLNLKNNLYILETFPARPPNFDNNIPSPGYGDQNESGGHQIKKRRE